MPTCRDVVTASRPVSGTRNRPVGDLRWRRDIGNDLHFRLSVVLNVSHPISTTCWVFVGFDGIEVTVRTQLLVGGGVRQRLTVGPDAWAVGTHGSTRSCECRTVFRVLWGSARRMGSPSCRS